MNDEQVFQLLMEMNPVRHPDELDSPIALADIERRSSAMVTTEQRPAPATRRTGVLIAAAAALILVIGFGGLALVLTSEDVASAPEIDTVMSAYEAINDGDIEGYFALLTPEFAARDRADIESDLEMWAALNYRAEVVEPCHIVEPGSRGETRVECTVTETNDFHGAGGLTATKSEVFVLDADGLISNRRAVFREGSPEHGSFNGSYWVWLERAHPSVYEQIKPVGSNSGAPPGYRTDPSYARIGLEYVEEFVEQSNAYPLESDS